MCMKKKMSKNILLVEDDPNLGDVLSDFLSMEGFNVTLIRDGLKAWQEFQKGEYHLCLLDCMLPKKDGFSLARDIRGVNEQIPIIFLTAKSMKADKLRGFDLGGDDYITKPFDEDELLRRINAVLKRSVPALEMQSHYSIGSYLFDYPNLSLVHQQNTIRVTQKEGDVLHMLCQHINQVVRREDLLLRIWGENDYFHGRSLDVFITKLRKYLKKDPKVNIRNIHGVGFELGVESR